MPTNGATVPGGTVTLQWARPTQGTDPLRYDVILDGAALPGCTNLGVRQCLATVPDGTTTHLWKVIARNACGATTDIDTPSEWRFKACSAPSAPDATSFTWQPNGQVVVGGVVQQQPYVGQEVTFSYHPNVAPTTMTWTDCQRVPAVVYAGVWHPTVVYASASDKKMYLKAGNCAGTRTITHYVKVYADVRPVTARFSLAPANPAAVDLVTVTFDTSAAAGDPDQFTVDFGDGTPVETTAAAFAQHAYRCGRTYRITVTARRTRYGGKISSTPAAADIEVTGQACVPRGFLLVDVPRLVVRPDGSQETGGVAVFNPSAEAMSLVLAARDTASGQLHKGIALPPLAPKGSMALADLVGFANLDLARATLWLESAAEGATELPVVGAWSFVEYASGQRHGQSLPMAPIWPAASHATARWISGLMHNSLAAERGRYGSISRLTFVDPTITDAGRTPWGTKKLILRLYDVATGSLVRIDSLNLDNYSGYRSDYLNRIFHLPDAQDLSSVLVKIEIPAGVSVISTAAVTDNSTASTRIH